MSRDEGPSRGGERFVGGAMRENGTVERDDPTAFFLGEGGRIEKEIAQKEREIADIGDHVRVIDPKDPNRAADEEREQAESALDSLRADFSFFQRLARTFAEGGWSEDAVNYVSARTEAVAAALRERTVAVEASQESPATGEYRKWEEVVNATRALLEETPGPNLSDQAERKSVLNHLERIMYGTEHGKKVFAQKQAQEQLRHVQVVGEKLEKMRPSI